MSGKNKSISPRMSVCAHGLFICLSLFTWPLVAFCIENDIAKDNEQG